MADDTGDDVGTAPTRLVLVHDAQDPARNLNPHAGDAAAASRSHPSDSGKTEISEETARALIEGLQAPRFATRVPHTATSNGEHVARFHGETLPLPAHTQPDVPATIIDVTDRIPIVALEIEDPILREEARTEPTRSLAHDTLPNAVRLPEMAERGAPTMPSMRIASESAAPVVTDGPSKKKLAFGVGFAVVLLFLIVSGVKTLWETSSPPSVTGNPTASGASAIAAAQEIKIPSASVVASLDAATTTRPNPDGTTGGAPSTTNPRLPKASQATPTKSPRGVSLSPANDTPNSARVEHEAQ